jgi:hypothetical protein
MKFVIPDLASERSEARSVGNPRLGLETTKPTQHEARRNDGDLRCVYALAARRSVERASQRTEAII